MEIKNSKRSEKEEILNEKNEENKNQNQINLLGKKRKGEKIEKKEEFDEFLYRPTVDFSDLGGMDEYVLEIKEIIGNPLSYFNLYKYLNIEHVKGILLCGPPGCGKTTIAHAIGGEYKIPFYKITAPQIISSLSGESENKIRKLFAQVEQNAPSILFIDEIESILGKRENASKDMERRIIATITTCIDELGQNNEVNAPIFVIGATSKPEFIDSSVRRSGRFDKEIQIGFPNETMREKMLRTLSKGKVINSEVDFIKLAKMTPGYLAADLQSLMRESGRIAIRRILEENKEVISLEPENRFNIGSNKFNDLVKQMIKDRNPNLIINQMDENKDFNYNEIGELNINMRDFEDVYNLIK